MTDPKNELFLQVVPVRAMPLGVVCADHDGVSYDHDFKFLAALRTLNVVFVPHDMAFPDCPEASMRTTCKCVIFVQSVIRHL